jgi:putative endonuclease
MYTLYILYSVKLDRFYVGYTNDFSRRLSEHNRLKVKYTDIGIPWKLVYSEEFTDIKVAIDRELFIKSRKSKQFIINLISAK